MRTTLQHIYHKSYALIGVGAFNVFNIEQLIGVFRGVQKVGGPVIIQFTPVARNYIFPEMLDAMINAAEKKYPDVEFVVHLDHGNYEHCISAIESGSYGSVMIDASYKPFEENIRITNEIVGYAHSRGIAVEAELGVLSGMEDDTSVDEKSSKYTNPDLAKEFVERTHCDSLAVAIGTSHGAYKFSGGNGIQLDLLGKIQELLPGFPLVLHGASSVPANEVERINNAGGCIRADAKGTSNSELLQAIKLGVCKINIATDMRLIWTRVHREFFRDEPDKFDMVIPGTIYMDELEKFVIQKCLSLREII